MGKYSLIKDVKMLSKSTLQTLAPGRGHNEVRTFFENLAEEVEIPIYDLPAHSKAEDLKS